MKVRSLTNLEHAKIFIITYILNSKVDKLYSKYQFSKAVCGGELDMESGQLESPNYPEDYQPNKECIWRVSVPVGFQVALKFQSFEVCL